MLYSSKHPRYFPHLRYPGLLQMGLEPIPPAEWVEPDDSLPAFVRHKLAQRQSRGEDVYLAAPSSLAARQEFCNLLLQHLLADHRDVYRRQDDMLLAEPLGLSWPQAESDDLWAASLWIADDVVIMVPGNHGYELAAGSVTSPSKWRLRDKFGQNLLAIHEPVPGFATKLAPAAQSVFQHLPAGRLLRRFIWSVQPGNDLYWAPGAGTVVDESTPLYFRVERQVLRRLPTSGAVAFTIRVHLHPLAELDRYPGAIKALLEAIDAMPAPHARYKEFALLEPALVPWRRRMVK